MSLRKVLSSALDVFPVLGLDKLGESSDVLFELDAETKLFFLIKSALMLVSRDLIFSRTFCSMFLDSCWH